MEPTVVTVRVAPDALVKIYDETRDEVIYLDNADDDGQTAPIPLSHGGRYLIDVTVYSTDTDNCF
ncbi:MAG: hypothetical protein NC133_01390 [Prevotella sp.]|nr:hypothetical protein [Prevotella sp.]